MRAILFLCVVIPACVNTLMAQSWSEWTTLPDGRSNLIAISYSAGGFDYGDGNRMFRYKVRNNYPNEVRVTVDIICILSGNKTTRTWNWILQPSSIDDDLGNHDIITSIVSYRVTSFKVTEPLPKAKSLQPADANFRNNTEAEKQEEVNKQEAEKIKRQKELQLEQQRKVQAKINGEIRALETKTREQASVASNLVDGIGSFFGSSQANEAKKRIAEDNVRRATQFRELKRQIQNEEGELVDCSSCNGEGYHECRDCDSSGKKICSLCNGRAGETCTVCRGTGTYQVGAATLSCTSCFGKGVKGCTYCGNTGQRLCLYCNGLGKYHCSNCDGTGQEFKNGYSSATNSAGSSNSNQNSSTNNSSRPATTVTYLYDEIYFKNGREIEQTYPQGAIEWYLRAAENGHQGCKDWANKNAIAYFEEGSKLREKDRDKATEYWKIAATLGHQVSIEWCVKNSIDYSKSFPEIADYYYGYGPDAIIGSQVWMGKNLDVERFVNGDIIAEAKTEKEWKKAWKNKQPAWCYFNNESSNSKHGKLYNWYAVKDPRGLAPEGWHIPSKEEFLKAKSLSIAFNRKSLRGGGRFEDGSYERGSGNERIGRPEESAVFWSSSDDSKTEAWGSKAGAVQVSLWNSELGVFTFDKGIGLSVRCIRNK